MRDVQARGERGERSAEASAGIGAGPDEYAASVRELLGDAGIDALMLFYVDFHDGDPEAVVEAISAVCEGQPEPVAASVVRSDGQLPARTGLGVPNYVFPQSCAAALARAADRREWLSRPLGELPQYPGLDGSAARAVIASFLDREPAGGWCRSLRPKLCWPRTGSRLPRRIAAKTSSVRLRSRRKSALRWR